MYSDDSKGIWLISVYNDFLPNPGEEDSFISIGTLCSYYSIASYPYLLRLVDVAGNWTLVILGLDNDEFDIDLGFGLLIKLETGWRC